MKARFVTYHPFSFSETKICYISSLYFKWKQDLLQFCENDKYKGFGFYHQAYDNIVWSMIWWKPLDVLSHNILLKMDLPDDYSKYFTCSDNCFIHFSGCRYFTIRTHLGVRLISYPHPQLGIVKFFLQCNLLQRKILKFLQD